MRPRVQAQALSRARQSKAASADESLRDLQHGISAAPDGFKVLLRRPPAQGVQASGVDLVLKPNSRAAQARAVVRQHFSLLAAGFDPRHADAELVHDSGRLEVS